MIPEGTLETTQNSADVVSSCYQTLQSKSRSLSGKLLVGGPSSVLYIRFLIGFVIGRHASFTCTNAVGRSGGQHSPSTEVVCRGPGAGNQHCQETDGAKLKQEGASRAGLSPGTGQPGRDSLRHKYSTPPRRE